MKKIIAILLTAMLILSLAACGNSTVDENGDNTNTPENGTTDNDTPDDDASGNETPDNGDADDDVPPIYAPDGGGETEDVPVTDAGELVDTLAGLCEGNTGEMMVETYSLPYSGYFSNLFNGMAYTEGTKIAVNAPMIGSIPYVALLIEPAEGVDADEYAQELGANANPRWQICVEADTVKYSVHDGLILFIMTHSRDVVADVDALIDAFNG